MASKKAVGCEAQCRGGGAVGVAVRTISCHLRLLHGGRRPKAAGRVQPGAGPGVHVPPGARRLQPVHLGFNVRSSCRHVERPGLVGVDPRYSTVHALHLKVGCRRGRVNLSDEGGLGGRHFALHRRRRRGGEGVKARGSSACKRGLLRGVRYRQIQDVGVACAHPIRERSGGWRRVSCESRGRNRARFLLQARSRGRSAGPTIEIWQPID